MLFVLQLAKNGTLFGLFRFSLSFLFACWVNLAFKTTVMEDTHLTLAVIPFKVETNNSLFFSITNIREKFAKFPFLLTYTIPWFYIYICAHVTIYILLSVLIQGIILLCGMLKEEFLLKLGIL